MAPRRSSRGAAKAKSVDYSEMAYASPQSMPTSLHFAPAHWHHISAIGAALKWLVVPQRLR